MKKIRFSFLADADDYQKIINALIQAGLIGGEKDLLAEESSALDGFIAEGKKQAEKAEDYLKSLNDFYKKTDLACSEKAFLNPYLEKTEKTFYAQKKTDFRKIPALEMIKNYLVDLPDTEEFDKLRFHQNLVKINLDLPKILKRPEYFNETVMQAFENYQRIYISKYLQMLHKRQKYLEKFWADKKLIKQKILALNTFDKIEKLGVKKRQKLQEEFEKLEKKYALEDLNETEIKKTLQKSPTWKGISFLSLPAELVLKDFLRQLDDALSAKIAYIRTRSVLDILKTSQKSPVQKLVKLLSLTNLNKIVELFSPKTAPAIEQELKTLLA